MSGEVGIAYLLSLCGAKERRSDSLPADLTVLLLLLETYDAEQVTGIYIVVSIIDDDVDTFSAT